MLNERDGIVMSAQPRSRVPELLDTGALRFVVLERGHVVGDSSGHNPIFKPIAVENQQRDDANIWFSGRVVTTPFPGGAEPLTGVENPVSLEWDRENQALNVLLTPAAGAGAPVVMAPDGKVTLYCDPGNEGPMALDALRTLALSQWTLADQRQPLRASIGWPRDPGTHVLNGIVPPFNERFLTVIHASPIAGTLLPKGVLGRVRVGPEIAAHLVEALQGRLLVNHALGWNFVRLVERSRLFSMETSLGQSRPVGTPLLLRCVPYQGQESLVDWRLCPEVDPARAVIPYLNPQAPHQFTVTLATRATQEIEPLADCTVEYLVRQDWSDISPVRQEISAPPRSGQNVRFRLRDLSPLSLPMGWLHGHTGSHVSAIDSRAQLAAACLADAPKELAEKVRPLTAEDIRIELRPSQRGLWLPSAIVRCEVSAGPRVMEELACFVGPLEERLTQRATLGTQVLVELVARVQ